MEDFGRRESIISEQNRRIMEDFGRRESIISEQNRRIIEDLGRRESIISERNRRIAEDLGRRESVISEQTRRIMEDLGRRESIFAQQTRKSMEALEVSQLFTSSSLARRIALEYQVNRNALSSISDVTRQARNWTRLEEDTVRGLGSVFNLSSENFARVQQTWATGITSLLKGTAERGLWATNPALGARIASLPASYSSFCRTALRDLSHTNDRRTANALIGSVNLAESHLARAVESLAPVVEQSVETQSPLPTVPMRLYVVQHADLAASSGIEDPQNVTELVEKSPAAAAAGRVLDMLRLIPQVNSAAKLSGRGEILKPTTRMIEAALDLVTLVPTNKGAFADFIDCLYWLFYEGGGRDNLRYLSAHGGPYSDSDCEVIWAIKTFRNKWYRHDPDHGDAASIKKSFRALREALRRFGFARLPGNADDYRRLHLLLVNELVRFLEGLRDGLA